MVSTRSFLSGSKLSLVTNVLLARSLVSAATTVDFFAHSSCNAGTSIGRFSSEAVVESSSDLESCKTTPSRAVALYANSLDGGCTISTYSDTTCTHSTSQTIQAGRCFFLGEGVLLGSWKLNCADTSTLDNLLSSLTISGKANTMNDDADASTRASDQDPKAPDLNSVLNSLTGSNITTTTTGSSSSDDLSPGNDVTYEAISGAVLPSGITTDMNGALVSMVSTSAATPLIITGGVATVTGGSSSSSAGSATITTATAAVTGTGSSANSMWAWTQTLNASTTYGGGGASGVNGTYSATVSPPIATYAGNGAGRLASSGFGLGMLALLGAGVFLLVL